MLFKKRDVSTDKDTPMSMRKKAIAASLAEVDAEREAAAATDPLPQDDHGQWRRRITRQEAERIKRQIIGPRRTHFTPAERREFLEAYEVIADEPMPLPTSPTSHDEELARRARVADAAAKRAKPKPTSRLVAAAKVLLGIEEPAAEPPKRRATFFT